MAVARLFPSLTATRLQAFTYLFGIALFSISFLVFLNSSISFVVTDVIGRKHNVGSAVGTLGFADEVLALIACPLWGLLSDRIGVRAVAVLGYVIVGFSLIGLVQSNNVFPELLMGRLGFSLGGAACSTMVTAVLPAMTKSNDAKDGVRQQPDQEQEQERSPTDARTGRLREEERPSRNGSICHGPTPSVSSEITITPVRYKSLSRTRPAPVERPEPSKANASTTAGTSQLAGLVGMFTGMGALLALAIFLPLPAYFQSRDATPAHSVQYSFYIVAAIAFLVALGISFGLRDLPGEGHKSFAALFRNSASKTDTEANTTSPGSGSRPSLPKLLLTSLKLGFTDSTITLAYIGGFVARASSVAISLFIPLFVNAYFVRTGLCSSNPSNLPDIKRECERAYKLSAALSGIAETAALICAPLFGWLGGKVAHGRAEWPLLGASAVGVLGYLLFGFLKSPDAFHDREEGGQWAMLAVVLIGVSQIGSIVCSLSLLGRGINHGSQIRRPGTSDTLRGHDTAGAGETAPLLSSSSAPGQAQDEDRSQLKGSIAGIYSLAGGAGILLLTKLGGALFDSWTPGAPFFIMAMFNALLLLAVLLVGGRSALRRRFVNDDTAEDTT